MDEPRTSSSRTRDGVAVCRSVRFGVRHGADRPLPEVRRHRFDQIGPRRRRGAEKHGSTVPRSRPTPAPSALESPRSFITLACSSPLPGRGRIDPDPRRPHPGRHRRSRPRRCSRGSDVWLVVVKAQRGDETDTTLDLSWD